MEGKIKEAIDVLGAMEGSDSYVRRSRWTVDLAENESDKAARLQVPAAKVCKFAHDCPVCIYIYI